jgi:hypothetical protein
MLEEIIKYIFGEWRAIAAAPATFIIAILVVAGIIWWVMSWGYGRETSLLRQQVADLKDRLSGLSPDPGKVIARSTAFSVEYAPEDPELGHLYSETRPHSQTQKTTRVHRISITNNFGRQASGRLVVRSVKDKSGVIMEFARQSLRSPEAERSGDFTLNSGQKVFFDVAAYYKGDPSQVFVCGSIGGAHYPVKRAPFAIAIEITGEGKPMQKNYQFGFDKAGDLTFEDLD